MDKKLYLITHNKNKIREFKEILEPDFHVEPIDFDYIEPKVETCEEVVEICLEEAYQQSKLVLNEIPRYPILIEDSGLFIEKLNGFPGVNTAFCKNTIGAIGLIKLMKEYNKDDDRQIYYKSVIGFFDGINSKIFSGTEDGILSKEIKGNGGWDEDKVFIPRTKNSKNKTYAEIKSEQTNVPNPFRMTALKKLKEFLNKYYKEK